MKPANMAPDRERAKRVIAEIIRQAGGEIGKTKLFKTFWLAHLFYSKSAPGYLTDWPVVRMPRGPGIDKADSLLDELAAAGQVKKTRQPKGPFTETTCSWVGAASPDLPEAAVMAIGEAVAFVQGHSAESISELSHDCSRSWHAQQNGEEMNIYSDLIADEDYLEQRTELTQLMKAYDELF